MTSREIQKQTYRSYSYKPFHRLRARKGSNDYLSLMNEDAATIDIHVLYN